MKLFKQKGKHCCFFILLLLPVVSSIPAAAARQHSEKQYLPSPRSGISQFHLTESWVVQSDQQGSEFGLTVASAGDVNGDGYDDVIIGAPRYSAGVYREGAALVFHGSATGLSSTPDWLAGSGQTGARFGSAVACAGDINHDGYDDVVVGAYDYNDGQTKVGAVFVFHGSSAGLSPTPNTLLLGGQTDAEFGFSAAAAGDVNGDDYDDVIVGARWSDDDQVNEGAAYLFYGSASGLAQTPVWTATGGLAGAGFGSAVSLAGDVDGDGYDDVVVGAPHYDGTAPDEGAAFVFRGSPTGLTTTPHWEGLGGQADAGFGSAATAGDVDNDGFSDLAIGAPHYSSTQPDVGAVFLFSGSAAGLSTVPSHILSGEQEGAGFGISVGAAADVNGDSFDDIVIGSHLYSGDQFQEGAIFLYCGSANGLLTLPSWSAEGNKAETQFGYTAGTAGDVNSDGLSDVIAGAPQFRVNHIIVGQVVGYHGVPGLANSPIFLPLILNPNP